MHGVVSNSVLIVLLRRLLSSYIQTRVIRRVGVKHAYDPCKHISSEYDICGRLAFRSRKNDGILRRDGYCCAILERTMQSRSRRPIFFGCLFVFLSNAVPAHSQDLDDYKSLEQAVTFIVTGGFVELGEMKQIDDNTVTFATCQIPSSTCQIILSGTTKTLDRNNCIFSHEVGGLSDPSGEASGEYFFNNINVLDTTSSVMGRDDKGRDNVVVDTIHLFGDGITGEHAQLKYSNIFVDVTLRGNGKVFCSSSPGAECASKVDIGSVSGNLYRIAKAIDYVYSHCAGQS